MAQTGVLGTVTLALDALASIPECRDRSSVLLFGSHARERSCSSSDVDLLVICGQVDHVCRDFPGFSLDLLCETQESVLKKLRKSDRWNNHFLLNVLTDAVLISDPDGVGRPLIEAAAEIRKRGPEAMTGEELRQAEKAIAVMLRSAKSERLETYTVERRVLCRMRLDQVVNRAIYLNFKARRRWSSSFPQTVAQTEQTEPELYHLWLRYAHATIEEMHDAAAAIVNFTLSCLREVG